MRDLCRVRTAAPCCGSCLLACSVSWLCCGLDLPCAVLRMLSLHELPQINPIAPLPADTSLWLGASRSKHGGAVTTEEELHGTTIQSNSPGGVKRAHADHVVSPPLNSASRRERRAPGIPSCRAAVAPRPGQWLQ